MWDQCDRLRWIRRRLCSTAVVCTVGILLVLSLARILLFYDVSFGTKSEHRQEVSLKQTEVVTGNGSFAVPMPTLPTDTTLPLAYLQGFRAGYKEGFIAATRVNATGLASRTLAMPPALPLPKPNRTEPVNPERREAVLRSIQVNSPDAAPDSKDVQYAWAAYERQCFGRDELLAGSAASSTDPNARCRSNNVWNGQGLTILDSLDTLWLVLSFIYIMRISFDSGWAKVRVRPRS